MRAAVAALLDGNSSEGRHPREETPNNARAEPRERFRHACSMKQRAAAEAIFHHLS